MKLTGSLLLTDKGLSAASAPRRAAWLQSHVEATDTTSLLFEVSAQY